MKKIILLLTYSIISFWSYSQKSKTTPTKPSSACKCDNEKAFINCWKDPSDATGSFYIIEIQLSFPSQKNPAAPTCNYKLDSIFFVQPPMSGVTDRLYAFTEFTKIVETLSADKTSFRAQYRIPANIYRQALYLNRPMYSHIIMHYGTTRCQINKDYKIVEPLL